jgi:hypothetical protein
MGCLQEMGAVMSGRVAASIVVLVAIAGAMVGNQPAIAGGQHQASCNSAGGGEYKLDDIHVSAPTDRNGVVDKGHITCALSVDTWTPTMNMFFCGEHDPRSENKLQLPADCTLAGWNRNDQSPVVAGKTYTRTVPASGQVAPRSRGWYAVELWFTATWQGASKTYSAIYAAAYCWPQASPAYCASTFRWS